MPQIGPEQQGFVRFYEKEILQDSLTNELAQEKLGRKRMSLSKLPKNASGWQAASNASRLLRHIRRG